MPSGFRVADSSFDAAFDLSALRLFKISTYPRETWGNVKTVNYRLNEPGDL